MLILDLNDVESDLLTEFELECTCPRDASRALDPAAISATRVSMERDECDKHMDVSLALLQSSTPLSSHTAAAPLPRAAAILAANETLARQQQQQVRCQSKHAASRSEIPKAHAHVRRLLICYVFVRTCSGAVSPTCCCASSCYSRCCGFDRATAAAAPAIRALRDRKRVCTTSSRQQRQRTNTGMARR